MREQTDTATDYFIVQMFDTLDCFKYFKVYMTLDVHSSSHNSCLCSNNIYNVDI